MTAYVIWSFEHDAWWRPSRWGYTRELAEAGDYTLDEAARIVRAANVISLNEQAMPREVAAEYRPPPSFWCPRCRRRSFNRHDVRARYCGACHVFVDDER